METPDNVEGPIGDISFGLSDDDFARWWNYSLTPEDASEYCSLYKGTLEGARFVCSLQNLTSIQRKKLSGGIIVQAYCLAMNLPQSEEVRTHTKVSAQALYEEEYVQILMDRVRYRSRSSASERIAALTESKIVELFQMSESVSGEEALEYTKAAIDVGLRHMANATKERSLETARLEKRAHREALERAAQAQKETAALPSPADAKKFLEMLREHYTPEEFNDILGTPKALESGE